MNDNSVSVVLATHIDSDFLALSIESVLAQSGVDLELIVIGDGAPLNVERRLENFNDSRIRYLPVSRGGLTRALIVGCEAARHPYIARLDVGDFMLPGRLAEQSEVLSTQLNVGLVSSNFSMYTKEGYYLYTTDYATDGLQHAIRNANELDFYSPVHASVMFCRDVYKKVGGYRDEFYLTQDCDLWTRILEQSDLLNLDEILSGGVFDTSGISGQNQAEQKRFKRIVIALRDRRKLKLDTGILLNQARDLSEELFESSVSQRSGFQLPVGELNHGASTELDNVGGYFFIARCLMSQDAEQAQDYWHRLLKADPWHLKARLFYWHNSLWPTKSSNRSVDFEKRDFLTKKR